MTEEAKKVTKTEGRRCLNQLINVAAAEKVSSLRTEESFAEERPKGDIKKARFRCGTQLLAIAARMMPVRSNYS